MNDIPYAEVIYEPGSKSVVHYDDLDELKAGLAEHHRRAMAGESGAPQFQVERNIVPDDATVSEGSLDIKRSDFGNLPTVDRMKDRPAERVTKVILYEVHPADFNQDGVVHLNELSTLVEGMAGSDSTVNAEQLRAALRDEVSPIYPIDQGRHESMYKMEGKEIPLDFLDGDSSV